MRVTLEEIADKFRSEYVEAALAIAAARATKLMASGMPRPAEMLPAVQAVLDADAEPRHYAWFASCYGLKSAKDPEVEVHSVANAASPRVFTPEAAAAFMHWYETESARSAMAVSVAMDDRAERMASGVSEHDWLEDECQEPVVKAERMLALLGAARLTGRQLSVVRAGLTRLRHAPGYDARMFPCLARRAASTGREDLGVPSWAK